MKMKMKSGRQRPVAGDQSQGQSGKGAASWSHQPAVLIAALAALALACSEPIEKPREERVPVTVAQAQQKDVPVQIRAIGNVKPMSTVDVRALAGGQLTNWN